MRLTDRVLALMPPGSTINSTLTTKPAIGFLVVTNVDLVSKTVFFFCFYFIL
jgi:hypothetical protein